ncbi:MAG: hypothetical protein RLZZ312_192, partial [Bacteroidota bacterium]
IKGEIVVVVSGKTGKANFLKESIDDEV